MNPDLFRESTAGRLIRVGEGEARREWVKIFLRDVAEQARDVARCARRLQDLRLEWQRRLTTARASALLVRLADSLFNLPVLTIPKVQELLQVTYRSAQANVQKLVKAGIIRPVEGSACGRVFIAPEILETLAEKYHSWRTNYTLLSLGSCSQGY